MLTRGRGPDFSERDRALLALLRPHLHQAYLDAERRRGAPQLTGTNRPSAKRLPTAPIPERWAPVDQQVPPASARRQHNHAELRCAWGAVERVADRLPSVC